MSGKSNVERLEEAGVLDSSNMSEEHRNVVNNDMSDDEVDAMITAHKAKSRLNSDPWRPDGDGGAF